MSRSIENRGAGPLIQPVVESFQKFIHTESAAGILLMVSTVVALIWANSPWSETYTAFRRLPVTLGDPDICGVSGPENQARSRNPAPGTDRPIPGRAYSPIGGGCQGITRDFISWRF
ncbi:MAG: hypothetical protein EHM80_16015, partial [Nitrospiraceae bacterium]